MDATTQMTEQHCIEEEQLHYFGQMLNADVARVLADACARYAVQTIGRDRAIAHDLATLFKTAP